MTRRILANNYQDSANPLLDELVQYNDLILDSVANIGVDGTDTSMSYSDGGDFQNMADFTGSTTAKIDLGDNSNFSFNDGTATHPYTISYRVVFNVVSAASQSIFSKRNGGADKEYIEYMISGASMRTRVFDSTNSSADILTTGFSPVASTVYWMVITSDGDIWKRYVDGTLQETGTMSVSNPSFTYMIDGAGDLILGLNNGSTGLNGWLGEFAIWQKELDTTLISLIKDRYDNSLPML